ncbi:MAG TPA: dienelactone hydrolase family protein [Polyangiaceae bacterium]|nr:dienelactone hydrolase family protein [Polyangiaceae bacterium]
MNETQQYFATEIALDHADGLIPRREALRRLVLIGLTVASASSLLAACESEKAAGVSSTKDGSSDVPASTTPPPAVTVQPDAALATESITFPGIEGRTLQAGWATAPSPLGAVLVIHENRGLTDHIRNVAGRFAAAGYAALALDLLSEEGGTGSFADAGEVTGALGQIMPARFVEDMRSALDELARRAPGKKLGAIGFCFGGGMMWRLLGSKDPRLSAAAPFYGPLPSGVDFVGAQAAVLGVYAELDTNVNGSRDAATSLLEAAGLTHEIVTLPGANHAFFNDTGARYHPEAASAAWARVLAWFGQYLA